MKHRPIDRLMAFMAMACAGFLATAADAAGPSRAATETWILGKVNKYKYTQKAQKGAYTGGRIRWQSSLEYFKINRCTIQFKVKIKKSRGRSKHGSEYRYPYDNFKQYSIPIADIKIVKFSEYWPKVNRWNFHGLSISTRSKSITSIVNDRYRRRSTMKGLSYAQKQWKERGKVKRSLTESAKFPFRGKGQEANIVSRMNRAFLHLKKLAVRAGCRVRKKETF